jgi:hypothetical protein
MRKNSTKMSSEVPYKLKVYLDYNPGIPPLGITLKECKSTYKSDICTSLFITALFTIVKQQN